MIKNTLEIYVHSKQFLGTKMGNIILTSIVIADVELTIHDSQVCKNTNNSKKLDKGIKEEGNGKLVICTKQRLYTDSDDILM